MSPAEAAPTGRPERIGLFGGTFDPPHLGHLDAARRCREALGLDRVLLVVANHPWQKAPTRPVSAAEDRWAMAVAAAEGAEGVEPCRIEIDRGGPSYTVETAEAFVAEAHRAGRATPELFVVVGSDLVPTLPTWERVADLQRLVTLVVVSRPDSPVASPGEGWRVVSVAGEGVNVSSSQVRALVAAGESVQDLVPEGVVRCIAGRNLYAVDR